MADSGDVISGDPLAVLQLVRRTPKLHMQAGHRPGPMQQNRKELTMSFAKTLAIPATAIALALAAPLAVPAPALFGGPAIAQEAPAPTIDDAQLQAFVAALREVDAIEQRYGAELESADSEEARQNVITEANDAMVEAIEETPGITVQEYIGVLQQAQADPELNARIMAMLQG